MKVENRFLQLFRDLPVRYRRSWACFEGDDEGYPTKKDRRNRITGSRDNFSDHRIGSGRATQNRDPIRSVRNTSFELYFLILQYYAFLYLQLKSMHLMVYQNKLHLDYA